MGVSAPFENGSFILRQQGKYFFHAFRLRCGANSFACHVMESIDGSVCLANKLASCEQVKNRIAHKGEGQRAEG